MPMSHKAAQRLGAVVWEFCPYVSSREQTADCLRQLGYGPLAQDQSSLSAIYAAVQYLQSGALVWSDMIGPREIPPFNPGAPGPSRERERR